MPWHTTVAGRVTGVVVPSHHFTHCTILDSTSHLAYERAYLATLGMEAIYEFDVKDMPVTVAVSSDGTSVHTTGPQEWAAKIGKILVVVA